MSGSGGGGAPVLEQAKEQAREVAQAARQRGGELVEQTRSQIQSQLTDQKAAAAGSIRTVAQALRQTGDQLRGQEQGMIGDYTHRLADVVEDVSGYLQDHGIDELTGDVERFARRNPALFLGAAFGIGFFAARFLKSSGSQAGFGGGSWQDRRGAQGWDTGASTVTAGGSVWDGQETPDSPRGREIYAGGEGDAAEEEGADSYQTSGTTG